jgi:hypothetical protein
MGTAAEMAESIGYDDFFRPEFKAARAYEAARLAMLESRERGRGEGVQSPPAPPSPEERS